MLSSLLSKKRQLVLLSICSAVHRFMVLAKSDVSFMKTGHASETSNQTVHLKFVSGCLLPECCDTHRLLGRQWE